MGSELRAARVGSGLSMTDVGHAIGRSKSQVSRIERSLAPNVTVSTLARLGAVVGLDIRIRAYPGGDPLRDVAQVRLLERFRRRLPPGVTLRTEVPLPAIGDQRAWDGWIDGLIGESRSSTGLPVEAETHISDLQAMTRRLNLKLRDAAAEHVIVVAADTRANRAAVAAVGRALVVPFPVGAREALAALAAGRHPGGSALILI